METTELSTVSQSTSLSLYSQIQDPLDFITKMGKALAMSGVAGCTTEASGQVVAWACLSKQKDPFELAQRYHFMDGKLTMKAETMLADFRTKFGGKHRWVRDGKDGIAATLELTGADGNVVTYTFTIEEAKVAGYVKDKSNWSKRPDQMLRSRCITDAIRMGWPEISGGNYSEDEISDIAETPATGKSSTSRRESKANATATVTTSQASPTVAATKEPAKAAEVIADAEIVQTVPSTVPEAVPFELTPDPSKPEPQSASQAMILELSLLVDKCGWTVDQVCGIYNKRWSTTAVKFEDFSEEQQKTILEKIRQVYEAEEAKKAAAQPNTASA